MKTLYINSVKILINSNENQSRLNVLGGPGPAMLRGPYHPYDPRGGVGP